MLRNFNPLGQIKVVNDLISSGNGFLVKTTGGIYVPRSLAAGSNIIITNPDGNAGNPIIAYNPTLLSTSVVGTQNNYAPGISGNTIEEWNGASDVTITGLSGGVSGFIYTFKNISTHNAFFLHLSGSSLAANQFTNIATSLNTPIGPGGLASWVNDGTNWKLINHIQGLPISYTPSWTGSVSNPAIGNGTLTGSYTLVSTRLSIIIIMTAGTTTTFGSGFWEFSVPVAPTVSTVGSGLALDVVGGINHGLVTTYTPAFATGILSIDTSTNSNVDSTHPFTWASTDILRITQSLSIN